MSIVRSVVLVFTLLAGSGLVYADPVDINHANAANIAAALKGVGASKAEAIVAYRAKNGPFKSVDDLAMVKGIGQKIVDDNRASIRLRTDLSGK